MAVVAENCFQHSKRLYERVHIYASDLSCKR